MRIWLLILTMLAFYSLPAAAQDAACAPPITDLAPITPDNAANLAIIDTIGRGAHTQIVWRGDALLIRAESGWWRYNADLSGVPCRIAPPDVPVTAVDAIPNAISAQIPADELPFTSLLGTSPSESTWLTLTSIFASERSRIDVWNADATLRFSLPPRGIDLAFNADESQFALLEIDGAITIYAVATGDRAREIGGYGGYEVVETVSADGSWVALGARLDDVRVWDIPANNYTAETMTLPPLFSSADGTRAATSPDGQWQIVAHPETEWGVYALATRERLLGGASRGSAETINHIDVAISNTHVAHAENGDLWLYTLSDPAARVALASAAYPILAFSPDGAILAYAAPDATFAFYDVARGAVIAALGTAADFYADAGFSADGRLFATLGGGVMEVWDVAANARAFTVENFDGALAFSPDGLRLFTSEGRCYLCGSDESSQVSAARVWGILSE
jgi:WD40 repeat protein